jgi:hypothetical protein
MMSQEPVNITQVNPQPKRFILNDSASNTDIIFLPQAQESILEVTDVRLSVLKSFPPQLQIAASGTVSTSGWSNPQLVPFNYVQAPPDGIYDFEFVATPPQDVTAQVITAIAANYIWKTFPQELVGVRIHSSTNSKAVRLNAPVSTSETCD